MKKIAMILALMAGSFASAATVQGVNQSGTETFDITATVGNACTLGIPATATVDFGTFYWNQSAASKMLTNTVNVKCNTGAVYRVAASIKTALIANSTTLVATAAMANGDDANKVGADTTDGATHTVEVTVTKPDQSISANTYTGTVNVTLTVVAD